MSVLGQALGKQRPKKRNFFYPTIDPRCVPPLLAHLPRGTVFAEPCAGRGDLIQLLEDAGLMCSWALELEPQGAADDGGTRNRWPIGVGDALQLAARDLHDARVFISNLPWERGWLHPLVKHLAALAPLWSLHDAGWAFTKQAAAFGPLCSDVVAVGRLRWFPPPGRPLRAPGEDYAAYRERAKKRRASDPPDDCAWYRFDARHTGPTRFHFPVANGAAERAGQGVLL